MQLAPISVCTAHNVRACCVVINMIY